MKIELVLKFLLSNSGKMTTVGMASFWIFPNPSIEKTVKLKQKTNQCTTFTTKLGDKVLHEPQSANQQESQDQHIISNCSGESRGKPGDD